MMKVIRTLHIALFFCAAAEHAYAADSAQVQIEATVEAEYSLSVNTSKLSISSQEVARSKWNHFTVTTESNAPTGKLQIDGCWGEGSYIKLREGSKEDGAEMKLEMVRDNDSKKATFSNGQWKFDIRFGDNGKNASDIWVRTIAGETHRAGTYSCKLTVKAQAQ